VAAQPAVEQFLRHWEVDQPFYAQQFAEAVGVGEPEALALLQELEKSQRVHRLQDGWQPGPPPPPMTVDQI
jgi:hypothetical protein